MFRISLHLISSSTPNNTNSSTSNKPLNLSTSHTISLITLLPHPPPTPTQYQLSGVIMCLSIPYLINRYNKSKKTKAQAGKGPGSDNNFEEMEGNSRPVEMGEKRGQQSLGEQGGMRS